MKAIARVSIAVPDEFLKSLSQNDLKELILNRSRLNVCQQNRLWTAIGPCDVRINDEVELLVDLKQLVMVTTIGGGSGTGGSGTVASKIRPAGAQETFLQRLKRYLIEAWRHVRN